MLEITYLLTFFISCAYALLAYFCAFFMDQMVSPLPFGILLVCVVVFYFFGKTGGYRTTTTSFKSTFFKTLFLVFIPGITLSMLYQGEKALPALSASTPYIIVFLTSGIFLLQLLRHTSGTADQKKFEHYQKIQAFSFFLVAFVGTVFHVFELILSILNLLIIRPIGYLFAGLFSSVSQFAENTEPSLGIFGENGFIDSMQNIQKETGQLTIQNIVESLRDSSGVTADKELHPVSQTFRIVVTVIIALILLFILILILKGVKKEKRKTLIIHEIREESMEDAVVTERLKKHFAPPDIQIRYYYKKFMQKADSETNRLIAADTTQEISDKYLSAQDVKRNTREQTFAQSEATAALTDLYRKTRYSRQPVSKDDAIKMKKLLKNC